MKQIHPQPHPTRWSLNVRGQFKVFQHQAASGSKGHCNSPSKLGDFAAASVPQLLPWSIVIADGC